jgi:hypothetical protein
LLWFQGNDVNELKSEKEKRLAKIASIQEEIKAIDEKIAELEG